MLRGDDWNAVVYNDGIDVAMADAKRGRRIIDKNGKRREEDGKWSEHRIMRCR